MKEQRWKFDIPIDGVRDRWLTMDELMAAFRFCKESDPETANEIAAYAVKCGNVPAKLAYSKFLRTAHTLAMSQADRYQTAETMLREVLNILDLSEDLAGEAALELGILYAECLHRPVGALAALLYASRLGAKVEDKLLQQLRRKLEKMDINRLGSSTDALNLGRELYRSDGPEKLTELFLREAADMAAAEMARGIPRARTTYGQACLALGDFYDSRIHTCAAHERANYRAERDRMYARAGAYGYPEFLK